jgi:hypothetical protein
MYRNELGVSFEVFCAASKNIGDIWRAGFIGLVVNSSRLDFNDAMDSSSLSWRGLIWESNESLWQCHRLEES